MTLAPLLFGVVTTRNSVPQTLYVFGRHDKVFLVDGARGTEELALDKKNAELLRDALNQFLTS